MRFWNIFGWFQVLAFSIITFYVFMICCCNINRIILAKNIHKVTITYTTIRNVLEKNLDQYNYS